MLREEDIRRIAAKSGLSVGLTEKDYAIDWFLKGIGEAGVNIIFKGGTAIKKVYYPETWRYSHDLDFSSFLTSKRVRREIEDVFEMIRERSGVVMNFKSFHTTPGSVIANIQYIGPLKVKNRIRLDVTLDERILTKPIRATVKSKYPDVGSYSVLVYSLEEILAEKIRSILQRGKSRDYYDVWMLLRVRKFDLDKIRELICLLYTSPSPRDRG